MVRSGIQNILKIAVTNLLRLFASNVERQKLDMRQPLSFAQLDVKEDTNKENGGRDTQTIIKSLNCLGKQEVFATKTTNGWFLANGVVVSNCDALQYMRFIAEAPYKSNYKYVPDAPTYSDIGI